MPTDWRDVAAALSFSAGGFGGMIPAALPLVAPMGSISRSLVKGDVVDVCARLQLVLGPDSRELAIRCTLELFATMPSLEADVVEQLECLVDVARRAA